MEKWIPYVILLAIIVFVIIARVNLLGIPFERDEGCYSYFGQLILDGATPYVSFYELKPPCLYYAYAFVIMIFGNTLEEVHTGFLVINVFTIVLLYFVGKRLFNAFTGLITAASYAVLSLAVHVSGFTAQSEHLVVLFATAGLLVMLNAFESEKNSYFFISGMLVSLASLIKQSGAFFVLFSILAVVCYCLSRKPVSWKILLRNFIVYSAGVFAVYALVYLVLIAQGAFDEFLFWTYELPKTYVAQLSLSRGIERFQDKLKIIVDGYLFFWVSAAMAIIMLSFTKIAGYKKMTIALFTVFSCLAIVPGLRFFGHYWIQLLPALSLLVGVAFYVIKELLSKVMNPKIAVSIAFGIFAVFIGQNIAAQREYYFNPDYTKILRQAYGSNPFPEAKVIADFIKQRTTEEDTIAVLGSEPEVYFYTDRRCPSKHSYFEYLVYDHPKQVVWQREFIEDIEKTMPKYIVFFNNPPSLKGGQNADRTIYKWSTEFVNKHYRLVGIANMITPSYTVYVWDNDVDAYITKGPLNIYTFERK